MERDESILARFCGLLATFSQESFRLCRRKVDRTIRRSGATHGVRRVAISLARSAPEAARESVRHIRLQLLHARRSCALVCGRPAAAETVRRRNV